MMIFLSKFFSSNRGIGLLFVLVARLSPAAHRSQNLLGLLHQPHGS